MYTSTAVNSQVTLDKWYNEKLANIKRGYDTYWLDKPLDAVAVANKHTLRLDGGNDNIRYGLEVNYSNTPGVMKESRRSTQTAALDLSYRYRKLLMKNSLTVDNSTGDDSPYGSFSEYTRLNPYLRPYGENGEINKIMQTVE